MSTSNSGAHIQSASINIPLSRSPLERFGTKIPCARAIDFPVNVEFSVNALINATTERNLADLLHSDDLSISVICTDFDNTEICKYIISGAKLISESFSSSIGSNKIVDLSFSAQVGGSMDFKNNIFFSGANFFELLTEADEFLTTQADEILIL